MWRCEDILGKIDWNQTELSKDSHLQNINGYDETVNLAPLKKLASN